jgi:diacylglycerol kinase (ATP)
MMRWLAIANPSAGKPQAAERIAAHLLREGLVHDVIVGVAPGDGTRHARESSAFDGVVAIGGDGTVAAILAGLDLSRQRLAVMPAGHGNCLARELGAASMPSAVGVLRNGVVRGVDLLHVRATRADGSQRTLWAASTLAIGYLTDVVSLGRHRLARLGSHAYTVASLLVRPRRKALRVSTANAAVARAGTATGVVINNTAHLAYFRAFQAARVDDGQLDVMVLECGWLRQICHNIALLSGSRAFGPKLMLQARGVAIDLAHPQTLMVDGDLIGDVIRIEASCVPAALQCLGGP